MASKYCPLTPKILLHWIKAWITGCLFEPICYIVSSTINSEMAEVAVSFWGIHFFSQKPIQPRFSAPRHHQLQRLRQSNMRWWEDWKTEGSCQTILTCQGMAITQFDGIFNFVAQRNRCISGVRWSSRRESIQRWLMWPQHKTRHRVKKILCQLGMSAGVLPLAHQAKLSWLQLQEYKMNYEHSIVDETICRADSLRARIYENTTKQSRLADMYSDHLAGLFQGWIC